MHDFRFRIPQKHQMRKITTFTIKYPTFSSDNVDKNQLITLERLTAACSFNRMPSEREIQATCLRRVKRTDRNVTEFIATNGVMQFCPLIEIIVVPHLLPYAVNHD